MIDKPVTAANVPSAAGSLRNNILFVAKGGGVTFAGKIFLSASRLFTAVLLARLLGAEQYGLYGLSLSAANIAVVLATFGLDTALIRYIAILHSREDEEGVWGTLQLGIGLATFLSVMMGTLIYAFSFAIAETVFQEPKLAPLLQIISVIIPMLTLSEVLVGANRGFKRMDTPVIAQFVAQPLIRLVLILFIMLVGFNVAWAILTFGLADLVASFMLLRFLNKEFTLKRPLRRARYDVGEILGFSIPVWLSEMMAKFQGNIQTLLLGSLATVTSVGLFSIANQITLVSSEFSSSINTSAKPIMAALYDRGDFQQMGRIYQIANKWAVIVQLPIFFIMVLFPAQLLSIFGESFTDGTQALIILAFASLLRVGTGMGGIIIDMTGHAKIKLINSIIRLVVYLGFNILLIPYWGLLGAAAAILLGEGTINLIRLLQVLYLFRLMPYNWTFIKPLGAGALSLVAFFTASLWFPPSVNLVNAFITCLMMLSTYAGLLLLFGFTEQERAVIMHVRQRAMAKLNKR